MNSSEVLAQVFASSAVTRGVLHGREVVLDFGDPAAEQEALVAGAAVADVSDRSQIELTGEDRASFLHNLCTNEIRRLTPGVGCEAFLLDSHGRVLAYVFVFVGETSLVLETVPGEALLAHLDRYLIRERVELVNRSTDWGELLLAGPTAGDVLTAIGLAEPPPGNVTCRTAAFAGQQLMIRRAPLVHPTACLLAGPREQLAEVARALQQAGATPIGQAAVEAARIAAGSPWYGVDITPKTLPQEVARDDRTISFTKGCYIGQETVARLDARGHVNKTLCGVEFDSAESPPAGTALTHNGAEVGQVTSAAFLPRLGHALALAYLKTSANQPGTVLESGRGPARVVALPY